jgi:hypothetical protein
MVSRIPHSFGCPSSLSYTAALFFWASVKLGEITFVLLQCTGVGIVRPADGAQAHVGWVGSGLVFGLSFVFVAICFLHYSPAASLSHRLAHVAELPKPDFQLALEIRPDISDLFGLHVHDAIFPKAELDPINAHSACQKGLGNPKSLPQRSQFANVHNCRPPFLSEE